MTKNLKLIMKKNSDVCSNVCFDSACSPFLCVVIPFKNAAMRLTTIAVSIR